MERIHLIIIVVGSSTFMFTVGCFLRDQLASWFFMGIFRYSWLWFHILFWASINIQSLADRTFNFFIHDLEIFGEIVGLIIFFGLLFLWSFISVFAVHNTQKPFVLNFYIELNILIMPTKVYFSLTWLDVLSNIQHFTYTLSSLIFISFTAQNLLFFFDLLTHYLPWIPQESG